MDKERMTGVVSCYYQPNYGSMIQALATQMALDKLNIANETIDVSGFLNEINKKKMKYFLKASVTSDFLFVKLGRAFDTVRMKMIKNDYTEEKKKRDYAFNCFKKRYFRLSPSCSSIVELSKMTEERYTSILVGSDQLWLPGNIAADYYTLNWVPEEINTIAYATSFGQSDLPEDIKKKAGIFLKRIRHISVREVSGKQLVKKIAERDVPVVCDPTLLFTGDEWLEIQKTEPIYKEKYIFCYFLGKNPEHRHFAKMLRKITGYKIVALTHLDEYLKCDDGYADYTPFDIDPADFLNLIRHASYVCTDSFHCTAFSIQYKKDFFAFRRFKTKTKVSTNNRLDTLLMLTGLEDRMIEDTDLDKILKNMAVDLELNDGFKEKVEYSEVENRLEKIREQSFQYLKDSLNM
jgi:hypothetical protein